MKIPNLNDLQQLIIEWNQHIGHDIWNNIWFDCLEYCHTVYQVIHEDVVGNLTNLNFFTAWWGEKLLLLSSASLSLPSTSMRDLVLQVTKGCRLVKEDWDVFGKWFDQLIDFGMIWDEEEKSLGVVSFVPFFPGYFLLI